MAIQIKNKMPPCPLAYQHNILIIILNKANYDGNYPK